MLGLSLSVKRKSIVAGILTNNVGEEILHGISNHESLIMTMAMVVSVVVIVLVSTGMGMTALRSRPSSLAASLRNAAIHTVHQAHSL